MRFHPPFTHLPPSPLLNLEIAWRVRVKPNSAFSLCCTFFFFVRKQYINIIFILFFFRQTRNGTCHFNRAVCCSCCVFTGCVDCNSLQANTTGKRVPRASTHVVHEIIVVRRWHCQWFDADYFSVITFKIKHKCCTINSILFTTWINVLIFIGSLIGKRQRERERQQTKDLTNSTIVVSCTSLSRHL